MEELVEKVHWLDLTRELGDKFAEHEAENDRDAAFVKENYELLKANGFLSMAIPAELGGGGLQYQELCNVIRTIAHYSSSTALSLSMHQHLLAANIWKYKNGQGGEGVLKKVADNNLVLVSTGASDWLESNGEMKKYEGGFIVNAQKHFASQSPVGDILVTSAPYEDPEKGWQVLHFPVPFKAEGLSVMKDWNAMGMRGTGSNTVVLKNVFVPDSAVVLRRPRGEFHPVWNVVLTVAMPLIMSVYVGIAEKAASIAIEQIKKSKRTKEQVSYLVGSMQNELTAAQVHWKDMISICNNYDFSPTDEKASMILSRKTNTARACINTVNKAMEAAGAQSYLVRSGLEKLFRDVHAGNYHPLTEMNQQRFTGEYLLRA